VPSAADSLDQKEILLGEVKKDGMKDIRRRSCKVGHLCSFDVRGKSGFGGKKRKQCKWKLAEASCSLYTTVSVLVTCDPAQSSQIDAIVTAV
jgi:hypothetical protein